MDNILIYFEKSIANWKSALLEVKTLFFEAVSIIFEAIFIIYTKELPNLIYFYPVLKRVLFWV